MNIFMLLEMAADALPDRIALVSGDRAYSYADLLRLAQAAATDLAEADVNRLGYLHVNSPAAPIALFAAALAGKPYVPMNYRLTRSELDALLGRIAPARVITALEDMPEGIETVAPDVLTALSPHLSTEPVPCENDVAVELFTSGTTGAPKAAVLRHTNLLSYILGTVDFASADEDDAIIVTVPPYHIAGISTILSSVYAGRKMIQLPDFDPGEWLRLVREHQVSNAFLVPTMLSRIVDHVDAVGVDAAELPSLRALAYGGGKMPLTVIERAMALWPSTDFTNAYGLTETSSTICLLDPVAHRAAAQSSDPIERRRLASVGRPLPTVEVVVRDEAGRAVEAGEPGLIFVRGDQVAGEYLATGSLLDADGWFATRDRGYLDAEGYLFLDGRDDDVIVRGGENISPGEIEEVLQSHPAVAEAAVVSIPDPEWGEGVAAAIILKPGHSAQEEDLRCWTRERLRSSRVPQAFSFVEGLPYNETGKLLRRVIRDMFREPVE